MSFRVRIDGAWHTYTSEEAYLDEVDARWPADRPTPFTLRSPAPIGAHVQFGGGGRSGVVIGSYRRQMDPHCATCRCEVGWESTCYGWWQVDIGETTLLIHPREIVAVIPS